VVADSLCCLKFEVKMSWTLERPRRGGGGRLGERSLNEEVQESLLGYEDNFAKNCLTTSITML
jgi:hypothetical protein